MVEKPSLFGMIIFPIQQMQRIKERPVFWGALLTFCILSGMLMGISGYYEVNDPEYTQTLLSSFPNEIRSQVNVESIKATSLSMTIMFGLFAGIIVPMVGAMVLWIFARIFRCAGTFRQFFSFQVHLYSIYVCAFFVQALVMIIMEKQPPVSPLSLAMVLPVEGALQMILSALDLFTIWIAVLLSYGMQEIAQCAKGKAWLLAGLYLLLLIVLSLAPLWT